MAEADMTPGRSRSSLSSSPEGHADGVAASGANSGHDRPGPVACRPVTPPGMLPSPCDLQARQIPPAAAALLRAPPAAVPDRDAEVGRLLGQTMDRMNGPDQRRRLAVIGHLKAALAANAGDPAEPVWRGMARQMRFRADLVSALLPGRQPVPPPPLRSDGDIPLRPAPEPRAAGLAPPVPPHAGEPKPVPD